MGKQRIKWIDACKGLGIILVVIGHVTHGNIAAGINSANIDLFKKIDYIIYSFHMTLFFILSGFTYNMSCGGEADDHQNPKLIKQLKNLFHVFTLFSIVQWFFKCIFSRYVNSEYTIKDLLLFAIKPMSPYWYLWVLIIYYFIFYCINRKNMKTSLLISGSLVISCLGSFIKSGFEETPKNLLFFLTAFTIGTVFSKYEEFLKNKKVVIFSYITTLGLYGIIVFTRIELQSVPIIGVLAGLIISLAMISAIRKYNFLQESDMLCFLGKNSLEIYVMHCFITAPLRKVFLMLNINNIIVNICFSTIISIGLSLMASIILKKCKLYKLIFRPFK